LSYIGGGAYDIWNGSFCKVRMEDGAIVDTRLSKAPGTGPGANQAIKKSVSRTSEAGDGFGGEKMSLLVARINY